MAFLYLLCNNKYKQKGANVYEKKYLFILLTSLLCLTSCRQIYSVYKVYIDEEYHLRAIHYDKGFKPMAVDEYYYTSDIYSGHIVMNITIPKEINGMQVTKFGRSQIYSVGDEHYRHDRGAVVVSRDHADHGFAIICYSYFKKGTTFDININCEAKVYGPLVFALGNIFVEDKKIYTDEDEKVWAILIYNNNESSSRDGVSQLFPCNLSITVDGKTQVLDYKYACVTSNIIKQI